MDRGSGDAALWSRAAHGDHDALGQLFDRHAGAVGVAVAQAAASSHVIQAGTGTGTVTVTGS